MVTPINTIDHSEGYIPFSSSVDQTVQYDEAALALYWACEASGTIVQSCDGSAVNTSGSNIVDASDMVFGTAASQAHTWWIWQPFVGDDQYYLFELDNSNADTTPQQVRMYKATAPYNTDGSTTTKPTISIAGREFTSFTVNLIPHTSPVDSGYFWWASSSGCFVVAVRQSGDAFYRAAIAHFQGGSDGDGETAYAGAMFYSSGTTSRFTNTNFEATSSFLNSVAIAAGTAMGAAAAIMTCPLWLFTNWSNGQTASRTKFRELTMGTAGTGTTGRYYGVIDDIRAGHPNLVFNSGDLNEAGTHRLRSLGGVLLVPLRVGTPDV